MGGGFMHRGQGDAEKGGRDNGEVRVVLEGFKAVPALCEVSLWKYPGFLNAPSVSYDRDGRVTLTARRSRYPVHDGRNGTGTAVTRL